MITKLLFSETFVRELGKTATVLVSSFGLPALIVELYWDRAMNRHYAAEAV